MKILVIDDRNENIESAKKLINSLNSGETIFFKTWKDEEMSLKEGVKIEAVYVNDAKTAVGCISAGNFDAILSDVFFDYEGEETSFEIREKIAEILGPYGINSPEYRQDTQRWLDGNETPPSGVLLAKNALAKNPGIVVVFNTSIHHHSNLGEPVSSWARAHKNRVQYTDSSAIDRSCDIDRAQKIIKDWKGALLTLLSKDQWSIL